MRHAHLPPLVQEGPPARLLHILNAGATALMISIGHRTGLFDAMDHLPPSTPEEIADRAQVQPRYVREWLGALTCAGIVEVDRSGELFHLSDGWGAHLTRRAGAENWASFAQSVSLLGAVESKVVRCFFEGGGVGDDEFARLEEVMDETSSQFVLSVLLEQIVPLVPGLAARLGRGIEVLHVGCGRGAALLELAPAYPKSRFYGYDLREESLHAARRLAHKKRLSNVVFLTREAEFMTEVDAFDFIFTFGAIHDQARPDRVLGNIQRALKTDGTYLLQNIDASSHLPDNLAHPWGAFLYAVSTLHCMTVSLARGGMGLGTMWGTERARLLLREAGFSKVREHTLPRDARSRYFIAEK